MRSSTLLAGLFALLIVAGVSFGAGYYVAKASGDHAPQSRPIASLDTSLDKPTEEGSPLPMQQPERREESASAGNPTAESAPGDVVVKPSPTGLDPDHQPGGEQPDPALPSVTPGPSDDRAAALKDMADRLRDAGLPDPDSYETIFNGSKTEFTATLGGQVMDAMGMPVAGASVHANFSENYSSDEGGRTVRLVMAVGEEKGSVIATTDGGGYWTATVNRKVSEKASLNVSLVAGAQGYADSKKETVTLKNEDKRDNIKLTLRGAGSVSGRVVNAHGMGVEGVTVSLRSGGGDMFGGDNIEIDFGGSGAGKHSAVTDGAGEFQIEGVPEGRYKFKLTGAGYRQISGPTEIDVKSGQAHRAPTDFQVETTASVSAKFVGADGKPVRGFATFIIKDGEGKVVKRLNGSVNESGVFERNDPPIGNFQVEILVHGFKTQTVQATFLEGQRYDFGTLTLEKDDNPKRSGVWFPESDE